MVNTAGVSLVGNVHSKKWAREVRDSRVRTTTVLAEAIAAAGGRAAFLVSNGIAYYGDHGSEVVTEDSPSVGSGFLTKVTREWQAATEPAAAAGARVCVLRTSPVATKANPLYRMQIPLFQLGLGTRMGSGKQYSPLISLRDWVGAVALPRRAPDRIRAVQPVLPGDADQRRVHRRARQGAAPAGVPVRPGSDPAARGRADGSRGAELHQPPARRALVRAGYVFRDGDVHDVLGTMLNG